MANKKLISFSEWLSSYDNICDEAVAYMKALYAEQQMTYEQWEARMDEACTAHPEWAGDN